MRIKLPVTVKRGYGLFIPVGLDSLPAQLSIATPTVIAELLPLPLGESEKFHHDWKKGIVFKILNKDCIEYDNSRVICILPAVAEIIAKVILQLILKD